jgi:hypothetical protein
MCAPYPAAAPPQLNVTRPILQYVMANPDLKVQLGTRGGNTVDVVVDGEGYAFLIDCLAKRLRARSFHISRSGKVQPKLDLPRYAYDALLAAPPALLAGCTWPGVTRANVPDKRQRPSKTVDGVLRRERVNGDLGAATSNCKTKGLGKGSKRQWLSMEPIPAAKLAAMPAIVGRAQAAMAGGKVAAKEANACHKRQRLNHTEAALAAKLAE